MIFADEHDRYHVFGVGGDRPMLIDCVAENSGSPVELLENSDVFEIECVSGHEAAQQAVAFWRAYFRWLGLSVG